MGTILTNTDGSFVLYVLKLDSSKKKKVNRLQIFCRKTCMYGHHVNKFKVITLSQIGFLAWRKLKSVFPVTMFSWCLIFSWLLIWRKQYRLNMCILQHKPISLWFELPNEALDIVIKHFVSINKLVWFINVLILICCF